jgi:hypothetical protein
VAVCSTCGIDWYSQQRCQQDTQILLDRLQTYETEIQNLNSEKQCLIYKVSELQENRKATSEQQFSTKKALDYESRCHKETQASLVHERAVTEALMKLFSKLTISTIVSDISPHEANSEALLHNLDILQVRLQQRCKNNVISADAVPVKVDAIDAKENKDNVGFAIEKLRPVELGKRRRNMKFEI